MNRHPHDHSWYGFATFEGPAIGHGGWGCLNFGGWVDTAWGRVELPVWQGAPDWPLYLVGALYHGRLLMGGQSQNGHGTWFWTDGEWFQLDKRSFGVSPCAFSQDGHFFYAVTDAYSGFYRDNETGLLTPFGTEFFTDGIRAVIPPQNKLVLGNLTKYSSVYDLYEYIDFENGLAVGQGQDGMVVWYQGIRYLIEPGGTFFIRAMFNGWDLALATHKQTEKQLVNWYLSLSELPSFPISGADEPIVAMNKPCNVAWFEFNNAPNRVPPGNSMIAIRWPMQSDTILRMDGALFAKWVDGVPASATARDGRRLTIMELNESAEPSHRSAKASITVESVEAEAAAVAPTPALAYWDGRNWPRWPNLPENAWLGLFGYCYADETMPVFEANLRAMLDAVPAHYPQIAIVCQVFLSNTSLTTNLKGLVPVYARIARDYKRVTFLAPFSDQGRATGLQDHPELLPYWQELFNGVTGIPDENGGGNGDGNGGSSMDWGTVHQYGVDRWAAMDVQGKSQALVNQGLECRDFQKDCFVKIASEIYHQKGIAVELFWKSGLPDYSNPQSVKEKLRFIGEDILVERAASGYKDVVVSMGIPSAHWHAAGGLNPVQGSDLNRCGPPPALDVDPPDPPDPVDPGDVEVLIYRYDHEAHRSDPHGMEVVFEIESARPVVEVQAYLEDGSPPLTASFPAVAGTPDGRYYRGIRFKATINGSWALVVRAKNDQGVWGEARGASPVTVSP